ncbi:hypothetical protein POPTR_005G154050v4 [Populus trichocarpa]|uniref:Uncharacterized protein n=1 Tax=Populus trichocarpa TaxID=3694 RepID=A0ACC0T0Q9_POPTR|nr:hypothetical protein POPTR_005G154050v4 [Populus trichocarpa]
MTVEEMLKLLTCYKRGIMGENSLLMHMNTSDSKDNLFTGKKWQEEETHGHLFFACAWTSTLWGKVKYWLRLTRNMANLTSAIRAMNNNKKGLQSRMKRVGLALVVYIIWEERNRRVFENAGKSIDVLFRKFQILFYIVLYFHDNNHLAYNVAD